MCSMQTTHITQFHDVVSYLTDHYYGSLHAGSIGIRLLIGIGNGATHPVYYMYN